MKQVVWLAALILPVLVFTAAVIQVVGAPSINVVSGLIGAVVPVLLTYVVIQSAGAESA